MLRLISGGIMLDSTGNHSVGVDLIVPLMIRWQLFKIVSIRPVCALCDHTGQQYSAVEYTNDSADVLSVEAEAPHAVPASFCMMLHRDLSFPLSLFRCVLKVNDRSNVLPRYFGVKLYGTMLPQNFTLIFRFAFWFDRWNVVTSVLLGLALSRLAS